MPARLLTGSILGLLALGITLTVHGAHGAPVADPSRQHWAFAPVQRPRVPTPRDRGWVRTPVDTFVLARLEQHGLEPAPPADRRTLLRRVYLDLIGLPPTPEEQRAFLDDPSPNAYEKVVDRLLASPHYGERWARHWFDVVRYADTNGYERDGAKPHAWRYRDYVIDSFNRDKPYDRFVTEQVAGDELDGPSAETQTATTFLRLGTWDDEPAEPLVDRYDQLDDVLGTTAAAFLGVTLRCARCHDHKFEPFSQVDYYRMLAVFEPLKRPQKGRADLDLPVGNPAEVAAYREATTRADAETAALWKQVDALEQAILARRAAERNPDAVPKIDLPPPEAVAALRVEPDRRTLAQSGLVLKYSDALVFREREVRAGTTPEEAEQCDRLEKQIAALNAARPRELPRAYIWEEDGPTAPVTHVLHRGDPGKPRQAVESGVPAVLVPRQPEPPRPLAGSTGRRRWLTRWLTRPDNPLVARVMVNRIWQHHFGRGLVATANDFGTMGEPPTHPELLDWLAAEFVARSWSVKALDRLIVLSSTYRTAAGDRPGVGKADPRAALLGRWRPRRLEAEAVRDSLLAVSGRLNPEMGGPGVYPPLPRAVLEGQSRPGDGWGKSDAREAARRSVYVFEKRSLAVPELEVLDAPDTTSSCEQRIVSTVAPQALTFLNGEFANEQARALAERLRREAGADPAAQLRHAFELALCRSPRAEELQAGLAFLSTQERQIEADLREQKQDAADAGRKALEAFCLVLLNTNEFVYLE
jgi:hypothetical protein